MADSVIRFLFKGDPQGAKDAFRQVDVAAGSLDQKARALSKAVTGVEFGLQGATTAAVGAAAGMAAIRIGRFVADGFEAADAMAKLSRRLGVATEDIAAYHRAAELSGTTQEAVTTAMERMNRTFGDAARGSAEAAGSLERLGLDVQRMLSLSPPEQFSAVAAALADIESPALRSARAQEVLGRSAGQLSTLLLTEQETMERARYEAELFGTALSDDAAVKVEAANDAISRLGLATKGLSVQMAVTFAPAVKWLGDAVQSAVEGMGGMAEVAEVASTALVALTGVASAAIVQKLGLAFALRKASLALVALGGAARVAGSGLLLLGGPAGLALAAAAAVALFVTRSRDAAEKAQEAADSFHAMNDAFDQLSESGKKTALAGMAQEIETVRKHAAELRREHLELVERAATEPISYSAVYDPPPSEADISAANVKATQEEAHLAELVDTHNKRKAAIEGTTTAVITLAEVDARWAHRLPELTELQARQAKEMKNLEEDYKGLADSTELLNARKAALAQTHRDETAAANAEAEAQRKLLDALEPARVATEALAGAQATLKDTFAAEGIAGERAYAAQVKLIAAHRHGLKVTAENQAAIDAHIKTLRAQGLGLEAAAKATAEHTETVDAATQAHERLIAEGERWIEAMAPAKTAQELIADAIAKVTAKLEAQVKAGELSQEQADATLATTRAGIEAHYSAADAVDRETEAHLDAADAAREHANANGQLIALLERLTGLDLGALRGGGLGGLVGEPGGLGGGSIGGGGLDLGALFSLGNLYTAGGSLALGTDLGKAGAAGYLGNLGVRSLLAARHPLAESFNLGAGDLFQGGFNFADLGKNALAGVAGSYAGNFLGEGIFGKVAENNHLATLGSLVGAGFGGPLGSFIGSLVGSALDVAFGGDGYVRSNVGAFVTPNKGFHGVDEKDRLGATRTGASGLEFTPFARRGDKAAAEDFTDALYNLDSILTAAARAHGVTVDFAGRQLPTGRSADDGGGTNSYFGASSGAATTPEEQARLFVQGWIDALGGALPPEVKAAVDAISGATAEELATAFGAALQIDKLLDLEVVDRASDAINDLLHGQRSLSEQYEALTAEVLQLAENGIAGVDSLTAMNEALLAQKRSAAQLSLAYHALSEDVDALLGRTVANIQASLRTPQEQYAHLSGVAEQALATLEGDSAKLTERFRELNPEATADEIAQMVTEALKVATSPEGISHLVRRANDALAQGWQLLGEGQRAAMAAGLIAFLEEVDAAAQARITGGLGDLKAQEDAVALAGHDWLSGIDAAADKQSEAGDKQKEAGNKQGEAGDRQYDAAVKIERAATTLDALVGPYLPLLAGIPGEGPEVNAP